MDEYTLPENAIIDDPNTQSALTAMIPKAIEILKEKGGPDSEDYECGEAMATQMLLDQEQSATQDNQGKSVEGHYRLVEVAYLLLAIAAFSPEGIWVKDVHFKIDKYLD